VEDGVIYVVRGDNVGTPAAIATQGEGSVVVENRRQGDTFILIGGNNSTGSIAANQAFTP